MRKRSETIDWNVEHISNLDSSTIWWLHYDSNRMKMQPREKGFELAVNRNRNWMKRKLWFRGSQAVFRVCFSYMYIYILVGSCRMYMNVVDREERWRFAVAVTLFLGSHCFIHTFEWRRSNNGQLPSFFFFFLKHHSNSK